MKWYAFHPARCPAPLAHWLGTTDSLTARLNRAIGAQIRVNVLQEGPAVPLPWEADTLDLPPKHPGWQREVQLCHPRTGRALLQARTFVPHWHLSDNPWHALETLGPQPLGAWLFQLQDVQRGPTRIARTTAEHWPWQAGQWARHTLWYRNGFPLSLTEVFLFHELHTG